MSTSYDAIVIGTGAGGAAIIHKLVGAGLRVLALEKGPRRELKDIVEGGTFGGTFSSVGRGDEIKYVRSKFLQQNVKLEERWILYSDPGKPEPATPEKTSNGWLSQLVGGGTVHYGGASFRPDPVDFRMRDAFGEQKQPDLDDCNQADLMDWVVGEADFEPWFSEAEKLIGIAAAPGSGLPPLRMNKAERYVAEVLEKAGDFAEIIPTPMAINSAAHGGRNPCQHSGLCQDFACRFEAKSDMRVTLLRDAEATGLLTIQPDTMVRRLEHTFGKVTAAECVVGDPVSQRIETYRAPLFVVACEVIESIRLLMASGLGNREVLGTRVMFHVTGGARSIAPVPTTTWDNAPHTAFIRSYYNQQSSGPAPFIKAGILLFSATSGPLAAMQGQVDKKFVWGDRARRFLNEVYPKKMDLSFIGEGMPTAYNRVELMPDSGDRFGMPVTKIVYRPHPFDINAGLYMAEESKRILKLAGAITEDEADPELKPFLKKETTARRLFHTAGGARFGEDPRTSVLDAYCRVHEMENLYLTDASFMPTGLAANPTLTIQANGLRVGDHLARTWGAKGASATQTV
jgi:choline dehydrogenase-like flavoprotein